MAYTTYKSTSSTPNFLASEVGLITKTVQVDGTGISEDGNGYKTVKAGTIYPANNGTAKGIIFQDVDVTHYEHAAPLMVAGRVYKNKLGVELETAAETALKASGIVFEAAEAETYRAETKAKDFTADTTAFSADDIAENADGLTLTITAIGTDNDTSIATVALSSSTHKVTATKVAAGKTQITCTVTDSIGSSVDIVVPIVIS